MKFKRGDVIQRMTASWDRRIITGGDQFIYKYSFLWGGHAKTSWRVDEIDRLFQLDEAWMVGKILSKYSNIKEK